MQPCLCALETINECLINYVNTVNLLKAADAAAALSCVHTKSGMATKTRHLQFISSEASAFFSRSSSTV